MSNENKIKMIKQRRDNADQCRILAKRAENDAKYWLAMAEFWEKSDDGETEDDSGGTPGGPVPPPPRP